MVIDDSPGYTRYYYTGNQTGYFNYTGLSGFVSGGPPGSGISSGVTQGIFYPNTLTRRPWQDPNAIFNDALLDACYPNIELNWIADIELSPTVVFRVSDKTLYVQDKNHINRFYDARAEKAPSVSLNTGEWLSPNFQISDLQLTLNNRDGYYNQYLPFGSNYRQWSNGKITIKVGFGEKYENYFTLYEGKITIQQGLETTRDSITIRAFDKFDSDNPIPPNTFNTDTYPFISDNAGKVIPIVYGDWTEEVNPWGDVSAICINGAENSPTNYVFKVSDLPLQSLPSVYLHRGDRNADTPLGPIPFDMGTIAVDLQNGQFSIPVSTNTLVSQVTLIDNQTAGTGTNISIITGKDISVDFISAKVQIGDTVLQKKSGLYSTVTSVASNQIGYSGSASFAPDDEYTILTNKYQFVKGDKISVTCVGKNVNLRTITRISNASSNINNTSALSIGFDSTYWIADNNTQKIYNISFKNEIIREIPFTNIFADTVQISGLYVGNDNQLWVTEPDKSRVSRYNYVTNGTNQTFTTSSVTGIGSNLPNISGITVKPDNTVWIVNSANPSNIAVSTFYLIDVFSNALPSVIRSFNKSAFDNSAVEITDLNYDSVNNQLVAVDRSTNKYYRLNETTGSAIGIVSLSTISSEITYPIGVFVAPQDGTLFILDNTTNSIYNYIEATGIHTNPAYIARDILQYFGGHTFDEFHSTWNDTTAQLSQFKTRFVLDKNTKISTFLSDLFRQFNTTISLRFQKYSLFFITFDNFRTDGKFVSEIDIKTNSFSPKKELNQYFNSANASYSINNFTGAGKNSDTYASAAGISFAGSEVRKTISLPNVYRRQDIDSLIPLFVRLSVADPEFVDVTFGFRTLRCQIQDFLNVYFDGEINPSTGLKEGGRRYNNIPCMIRSMDFDLENMSIKMKLWSLGTTRFGAYIPSGIYVGGMFDMITLTTLGRLGRISATASITSVGSNNVTVLTQDGNTAQNRTNVLGATWHVGQKLDLVDGSTHNAIQTVTISNVVGNIITFQETLSGISPSVKNSAGFFTGGHYVRFSSYFNLTQDQKSNFACLSKPEGAYPTSQTQETAEQRGGLHSFSDGGLPYLLFPKGYTPV